MHYSMRQANFRVSAAYRESERLCGKSHRIVVDHRNSPQMCVPEQPYATQRSDQRSQNPARATCRKSRGLDSEAFSDYKIIYTSALPGIRHRCGGRNESILWLRPFFIGAYGQMNVAPGRPRRLGPSGLKRLSSALSLQFFWSRAELGGADVLLTTNDDLLRRARNGLGILRVSGENPV
jgi:hypothetical protein